MKLLSDNFNHLDEIPDIYTLNNKNFTPSLYWIDYNENNFGFLILMINLKTNNLHWSILVDKDINYISINDKKVYTIDKYIGPNDKNDIVTYQINIYNIKQVFNRIDDIIDENNVIESAYIKFIYNGF